ncbi:MAG: RNA polymerase subunit sigma-70 [Chloroflexi bacterium]|nr:RNA polymerase subunit sigma-70 [Chloroflexota bacterium]
MPIQDESAPLDLNRDPEIVFTELVEQYSDLAYSVAFRMLRNTEDAEDAVQEAYISAFKALPKFRGQSKLSTWLYRIVVNACLMKIRRDKSRAKYIAERDFDEAIIYDWKNDPEDAAVNSELRSTLEKGLDLLSPDLRAAAVLRDIQGLSTEEAAEALGISKASLKSRLHRARVILRQHLGEYALLSQLPAPEAPAEPA